ncbi:hypothetical protein NCS52_00430700 [Fusarium sp. LHS14.1]|nr:hypothetical protein NCS52_00430700 [Fusarium sp. LHS14.1]
MAEAGHGGALIKDVQAGLPEGPVTYASREWLDLVVHAVKGLEKRGMQAAMHNSPGYSGVGSHNLPVNETMKELVWTESRITANSSSDTILPKPFSKLGVYRDLFTLTYPTGQGEGHLVFRDAVQEVRINETAVETNVTSTIGRTNPLRLESKSAKLDIVFKESFTAQAIGIYRIPELPLNSFDGARDYPPQWSVSVSNNSVDWTSVSVTVSAPALRQMDAPAVITFNQVKAKYIRLVASGPTWITGIDVSSSPRLQNWAVKSHGAPGTVTAASFTTADLPSIDPSSIIDVSSHITSDGKLKWRLSVDLFSKKSIDAHFETHLTRVINALKPWILAATGRIIGSTEKTEKFLHDFRPTHADLVKTNSYEYFQERLRKHGLSLLIEPYGDGPFDSMELATSADFAYGEFWSHYTYGSDGYPKLGDSSSHIQRERIQPVEAFTGQPDVSTWTEHPFQLEATGDRMMTLGPNRFIFHSYVHQHVNAAFPGMTFGPFGTHFDRMNTWAKQQVGWNKHLSRVSYVLQNTDAYVDVACFISEETSQATVPYNSPYNVPLSYQADIFSLANLLDLKVKDSRAVYPSGTSYRLLIFPDLPNATKKGITKILELAQAGVPILLLSSTPTPRGAGLNDTNDDVSKLAKSLWGLAGNGNVFTNMTAAEALKAVDLATNLEFTSSRNDAAIYYTHRTDGSEDVSFVSNGLRKHVDVVLSLKGQGYAEILNPTTGETVDFVISSRSGARTNLAYHFDPSESIVVVMRRKASRSLDSVSKDGHQLWAATPFESFVTTPHQNISSSFTVTLWAKPEVAQFGISNYIIYPTSSYRNGHASMSLSLGIYGIQIGEATTSSPKTVIGLTETTNSFTVSGWTHFAIVYENNTSSLYVNGEMISKGTKSNIIVHPGLGQPDAPARMTKHFDGDLAGLKVHDESLKAADIKALPEDFDIAHFSGTATYKTKFQLPKDHDSETIKGAKTRILLNLGRVENIASVKVNGKDQGLVWLPPYEVDITSAVRSSRNNTLEIEVTNCWPNRLIGDEKLPVENKYNSTRQNFAIEEWPDWFAKGLEGRGYNNGDEFGNDGTRKPGDRVTFTSWKHYDESSPLFESGLLGPVTVTVAELVDIQV